MLSKLRNLLHRDPAVPSEEISDAVATVKTSTDAARAVARTVIQRTEDDELVRIYNRSHHVK